MIMCFFVFVSFLSKVNALINGYELLGKIIFLDAGHGGVDAGSSYNDILEKDINLQLVRKLEKELISRGAIVYLTRDSDKDLSVTKVGRKLIYIFLYIRILLLVINGGEYRFFTMIE